MNNPNCPFCNNISYKDPDPLYLPSLVYREFWFDCNNHLPIRITLMCNENYNINTIRIYNEINYKYYILIKNLINRMEICSFGNIIKSLPIDHSLTPENFIFKLKTYLLFL